VNTDQIRATFDARSHAANELRSLYEEATGRELTAEERQTEERLSAAISEFDGRIQTSLKALEGEKRAAEAFEAAGVSPKVNDAEAPVAEARSDEDILRAMAGRDAEVRSAEFGFEERGTANLVKGTAGVGGNTVPTSFYDTLLEYMIDVSTVMAANATVLRTAGGEKIQVPVATAFPAAALVAEGNQLGNQDVTFAQRELDAFKYAFTMKASSELLADTGVNLVEFLARRGGEALGNAIGAAAISGTGSSQPQGLNHTSNGINTQASASGSVAAGFQYVDVLTLVHSVLRPYRPGSVFIANDSVVSSLRKLREGAGTGQFLWQPSLTAGQPDTLAGYPVLTDPAMPTAQTNGTRGLIFGNIGQACMVRFAGPVRVESSTDFAFDTDLTTWRFIVRFDSEVIDPNAAKVLTYTT
jgi:HK97 family phage major capsid protein